jgi:hypothetical protein
MNTNPALQLPDLPADDGLEFDHELQLFILYDQPSAAAEAAKLIGQTFSGQAFLKGLSANELSFGELDDPDAFLAAKAFCKHSDLLVIAFRAWTNVETALHRISACAKIISEHEGAILMISPKAGDPAEEKITAAIGRALSQLKTQLFWKTAEFPQARPAEKNHWQTRWDAVALARPEAWGINE